MPRPITDLLNTSSSQYNGLVGLWSAINSYSGVMRAVIGTDLVFAASTADPSFDTDPDLTQTIDYDGDDTAQASQSSTINSLFSASQASAMAIWCRPAASTADWQGVVCKGRDTAPGTGFSGIFISPADVWNGASLGPAFAGSNVLGPTVTYGDLYHVVLVRNGSATNGLTIWVNAVQGTAVTTSNDSSNSSDLITGIGGAGEHFDGELAQIALYNRVPSSSEIAEWYADPTRWNLWADAVLLGQAAL